MKQAALDRLKLAASASLMVVLTACSATTPGASNTPGTTGTPTQAPASQTSGSVDPRAYAGTTIRFAAEDNDGTASLLQVIDDFTAATGIQVEVEKYDETTLRQKLALDFTSHSKTFDVAELQYWFVPEFAKAGYLVPLDDLLAQPTVPGWIDLQDYPGNTTAAMQYDGKLYGLPVRLIGGMYYYRSDLFTEKGWTAPTTTAGVLDIAQKTKAAYGSDVVGWSGRGDRDFSSFGSFGGWAAAYGAKLFDDEWHPTLTSDPAWTAAITDWVTLMRDYSSPGAANHSWYDVQEEFMGGGASQTFETSDYVIFESPQDSHIVGNVGYAPAPTGPANKPAQWFFAGGYAINNDIDPAKKAAAWLFLQWRCSPETFAKELQLPDNPRFTIPSVSTLNSQAYDDAAAAAGLEAYAEGQKQALETMDPWYWPFIPEYVQVSEAFATNVSSAIAGQITVDQALRSSNDQIESIMSDAGYYK